MYLLQAPGTLTSFNAWTVLFAILGSGIISTLITVRSNRTMKDTEFKYDYRKYILDKRKKAYDVVEQFIGIYMSQNDIVTFLATRTSQNWVPLETILEKAGDLANNNIWLSQELAKELGKLQYFLYRLRDKIDDDRYGKPHDLAVDPMLMEKYLNFEVSLLKILFDDIAKLDDIKTFQNNKIDELKNSINKFQ